MPSLVLVPTLSTPLHGHAASHAASYRTLTMSTSPYTVLTTLHGHTSSINVIKSSPDGKLLASGGDDGTIIVYSTKTWKAVKRYGNFSPVTALAWHPTVPSVIIFGCKNGDVQTVHFRDPEVRTNFLGDNLADGIFQGGDKEYRRVWVDWMKDPVACIAMDMCGTLAAISHGAEVTVIEQPTICRRPNVSSLLKRLTE